MPDALHDVSRLAVFVLVQVSGPVHLRVGRRKWRATGRAGVFAIRPGRGRLRRAVPAKEQHSTSEAFAAVESFVGELALREFRLRDSDRAVLASILAEGSKSFAMASRLLPARMRDAVLVYYAYCRQSDDAIDESPHPLEALSRLQAELKGIFEGEPSDDLVSRELARLVKVHRLSSAPFLGLLEGFAWDTEKKTYDTLADLEAYCARVAGTVGISMTEMMAPVTSDILARAADLGVAMQLTNIARDIGTDARANRLYVPRQWLTERGVDPDVWLENPEFIPAIADIVRALLDRASVLYLRCESGIAALPRDCQSSIFAARLIYADIGRMLKKQQWDSVSSRAYVRFPRKLLLLTRAWFVPPKDCSGLDAPPLAATAWLCQGRASR